MVLKAKLAEDRRIPLALLTFASDRELDSKLELEVCDGVSIRWPTR